MVNTNTIKCGNSSAVYNAAPAAVKPDEVARCKPVPIHFGATLPVAGGFRVVARLVGGREAILALADTHAEAVRACWARTKDIPANTNRLALERWEGAETAGRWVPVPTGSGELPRLAPPVKGLNRLSPRARKWFAA